MDLTLFPQEIDEINNRILKEVKRNGGYIKGDDIPDYYNDLNACYIAETYILGDDVDRWLMYDKLLVEDNTKFTFHIPARIRAKNLIYIMDKY
jgi:hypothetical protein